MGGRNRENIEQFSNSILRSKETEQSGSDATLAEILNKWGEKEGGPSFIDTEAYSLLHTGLQFPFNVNRSYTYMVRRTDACLG